MVQKGKTILNLKRMVYDYNITAIISIKLPLGRLIKQHLLKQTKEKARYCSEN